MSDRPEWNREHPVAPIDSAAAFPAGSPEEPPQRLRLRAALQDKDGRLSQMYEAATRIMDDGGFPDRLSVAAHAMRELMEKLPAAFDLPLTQSFSVVNLMDKIEEAMTKARSESACAGEHGWEGEIDPPLVAFINTAESALQDRRDNLMSRKESTAELMKHLDPGHVSLTRELAKTDIDMWTVTRRYFESVSHHHHVYEILQTDDSEFRERVRQVEILLIGKLRPPTAEDFAEIDDLMDAFLRGGDG